MSVLFEEVSLPHLRLRNRLVRSATQDPFGAPDGTVTEQQLELCRTTAASGLGMLISGHVCVTEDGRAGEAQNCFYDERFVAGQSRMAETIHSCGCAAVLQISHAGGNATVPKTARGVELIAPTAREYGQEGVTVRAMTAEDLERVKAAFAEAAVRAKRAGFDGVQLHMAHGYLLSEFLSRTNDRTDGYGGSAEGRFRFPREVFAAVREAVGPDYPVFVKINCNCPVEDEEYAADFAYYMRELDRFSPEGIEVSGCNFTPLGRSGAHNYYLERAAAAAREISAPVFIVGGVRTAEDIQSALDAGMALISMSRPFICEPGLAGKLAAGGKPDCVSCSKCFYLYGKEGRRCILHPLPEK